MLEPMNETVQTAPPTLPQAVPVVSFERSEWLADAGVVTTRKTGAEAFYYAVCSQHRWSPYPSDSKRTARGLLLRHLHDHGEPQHEYTPA